MIDLQESRAEIDKIDKQIVELFEKRMKVTKDVANYKMSVGKPVFDKERELQKLDDIEKLADNNFDKKCLRELFTQIMSMSRKFQYSVIKTSNNIKFEKVNNFDFDINTKVACFGVKGSYTDQAMEEYFGDKVQKQNLLSFKEVMESVDKGIVDFGILPIENSYTGSINDMYDLLVKYDNYIVGEYVLKIQHALLGLEDSKIEDIKTVYSHQQGIWQSSKFLEEHSYMKPVEFVSTSGSAMKVKEDNDLTKAAIANKRVANIYGLKVLADAINDNNKNRTRFIIITNKRQYVKDADKISICFELPNKTGTLYNIISNFIFNNINMTDIESRPLGSENWDYRFFIDIEGSLDDAGVQNAINAIINETSNFKILGSFKKML